MTPQTILETMRAAHSLPTFRQFERQCDQNAEWTAQALQLPYAEIKRHASVSTNNAHECFECFCCACARLVNTIEFAYHKGRL